MGLVDHCLKSFPNGPCIAAILIPIPTLKLTPKPNALFCKRPMSLFMINIRGQKRKRKKSDEDITQFFISSCLSLFERFSILFQLYFSWYFSFICVPLWAFSTTSVISLYSSFVKPI